METTVDTVHEAALETLRFVGDAASSVPQHVHSGIHPSSALAVCQLEQAMPRGWSRPVFFFALPHDADPMEAVEILRKGLGPTKMAIPSLDSEIVPLDEGKQSGMIALRRGDLGSLIVKDLRGANLRYEELRQQNFPQSRLDPDVLCATEVFPVPGARQPVFVPQVNVIDGGLILSLSINHAIFDAQSINEVLRAWAQNCRHIQDVTVHECASLPAELFEKKAYYASHAPTLEKGRPEHHPEYLITPEPITFGETAFRETHRARVYRLTPEALAELKNDCTEPGMPWISTNDAVTALIWHSVIRAQVDPTELPKSTISHHIVNVDLRLRSDPPLPKRSLGCPMSYARPGMPLGELVGTPNFASIARAIRSEVNKRDPDYVDSVVTLLDTIPGYDQVVSASYPLLMGIDVLTSTWDKLDMYEFYWGPTLGHIERVRFTMRGLFNGATLIYPRVTKLEGQEGMEVSIGLDQLNFEKLQTDPVWCKYTLQTDPGY